jgi:hypothetical protein
MPACPARILAAAAVLVPVAAAAQPVPPPRPAELTTPPAATPVPPPDAAESACRDRLAALGVEATPLPAIEGPGTCGAPQPLRLVRVSAETAVTGNPVVTCRVAEALGLWVRDGLAPAARALGTSVAALLVGTSYQCRGRNNDPAAKLSEHAFANGVDLSGLKLGDGRTVTIGSSTEKDFQDTAHRSACLAFTTVLGPGVEGHADHLHLDMAQRRNGYRLCQ